MTRSNCAPLNSVRLWYFVRTAELGSVTSAAASLGIAQPSLSTALRKLEREVDVVLFDRVGGGVELTPSGREILNAARGVLTELTALDQVVESARSGGAASVSVAVPSGVKVSLFAPLATEFARRFGQTQLRVLPMWSLTETIDAVRSGQAELALVPRLTVPRDLDGQIIGHYEFGLAVPPGYPLTRRVVDVGVLDRMPFIGSRPGTAADRLVRAAHQQRARPHVVMVEPEVASLPHLVAAGVGAAMVTTGQLHELRALGVPLFPFAPREYWPVRIIHHKTTLSRPARQFLAVARGLRNLAVAAKPPRRRVD